MDGLSRATGMSENQIAEQFEVARKNQRALSECEGHDFEISRMGYVVCRKCGGEVVAVAARFYEQGLRHGRAGK